MSEELPFFVSEPMTIAAISSKEARAESLSIYRPAVILLMAVWFGLVAGLAEVSLAAMAKVFLHRFTHLNPHSAWMTPSAEAFFLPSLV